jgi:hypothetical protein
MNAICLYTKGLMVPMAAASLLCRTMKGLMNTAIFHQDLSARHTSLTEDLPSFDEKHTWIMHHTAVATECLTIHVHKKFFLQDTLKIHSQEPVL